MVYDTVVFDNDGVLVGPTSYDVLREATEDTFAQFGVTDPDTDHIDDMTVGATPKKIENVCDRYDLDTTRFWQARERTMSQAQKEEARRGRKTPYDDIGTLADLEIPMGIVSSNQQETVDFLINHFEMDGIFNTAYGREETIESLTLRKPHPHYLHRALADLDAGSALFVGDNESDILAAENAGIDSAFIRRPHRVNWDLNVWPTWDIDSLEDLQSICCA